MSCANLYSFAASCCIRLMGVSKKIVPRIDLQSELLPQPYVAIRDAKILKNNFQVSLEMLGVQNGGRDWVLLFDETCWHPCFDVISGLRDVRGYVGGMYCTDPSKEKSYLSLSEMKEAGDEFLAKLTQHYIVSRCETNAQTFSVNMLPRPQKSAGVEPVGQGEILKEVGMMLLAACASNGDNPPISIGYDAACAHALINRVLAGLAGASTLRGVPFFSHCKTTPIKLPCFSFGVLVYKETMPVLGVLDLFHVMKRFSFHLCTSARTVRLGDYSVEVGCLLLGGLSFRDYATVDIQSDKSYAAKLNPAFLQGSGMHWDALGLFGNVWGISTKMY